MLMFKKKVEPQGWLTFAQNSDTVNYVNQAYLLALSVKATCTINKFAVVIDHDSAQTLTDTQRRVFDYIIEVPRQENPFAIECQAWNLTPFTETFKVESDMLIPRNIDHWWAGCRTSDVVMTSKVRNYQGKISNTRYYRKFFDANNLADVYNGFMYFRYSRDSKEFFNLATRTLENFTALRDGVLDHCFYDTPDTDVIFGIAGTIWASGNNISDHAHAQQTGVAQQPIGPMSYPTFAHMKGAINGWKPDWDWRNSVRWTLTNDFDFVVGGYAQHYPFHYFQKDFCTEELIGRYEQRLGI